MKEQILSVYNTGKTCKEAVELLKDIPKTTVQWYYSNFKKVKPVKAASSTTF